MVDEIINEKRRDFLTASGQGSFRCSGRRFSHGYADRYEENRAEPVALRPSLHSPEISISRTLSWVVSGL
jgi:hypothetical protein